MMYRQGDLLFIKTIQKPHGFQKSDKIVLASSVTGHNHEIKDGIVFVVEGGSSSRWDRERANFFVIIPPGGTDLIHPEHSTIPLPEGTYEVIRQREVNGYVID